MATYQRKSTHTIEATQFTTALGDILRMHAAGTIPELPADVPALLVWSEQGGYRLDGTPISFGDYIVNGSRVPRDIFEREWEPAHPAVGGPAPNSAAVEAAIEQARIDRDAAAVIVDDSAQAPAKRSRRTRSEDAQ